MSPWSKIWFLVVLVACGGVPKVKPVRAPLSASHDLHKVSPRAVGVRNADLDADIAALPEVRALQLCASTTTCTYVVEAGVERASTTVPLVLVHGLGPGGVRDFYPILAELTKTRRVIAIDLPGLGRSTLGEEEPTPAVFAGRIRDVLEQRVRGSFDLLGHSLGGVVALLAASEHRERVRRLILVDVAGVLHREAFVGSAIGGALGGVQEVSPNTARLLEGAGKALTSALRPFEPSDRTLTFGARRLVGTEAHAALSLIQLDVGWTLSLVTSPTLIVWGSRDTIAPMRTANVLDDRIASSRLIVFDGVGHVPMLERPREMAQTVLSFLDDVALAPEGAATLAQGSRDFSCRANSNLTVRGNYRRVSLKNCHHVRLEGVHAEQLAAVNSDGEIVQSIFSRGIVAVESDLVVSGGRVEGEIAIRLEASRLDMAGTRVRGTQAAVFSADDSRVLFSVTEVQSPYTRGSLHGHVSFEDGQGL